MAHIDFRFKVAGKGNQMEHEMELKAGLYVGCIT